MAKRKQCSDDESPHRKRQKITKESVPPQETVNIQTCKDLQLLLAFEQDAGPHVRKRVHLFKLFLDSIVYGKESDERSARREILLEYLQSQMLSQAGDSATYPPDLVRTWHFATQANVESLFSSVVAVLALLLKAISTLVEFRECGNRLCRYLLEDDQIKLFDRGLSANKAKEHLVSPCLRLLTEIVSFDGGHSARVVFRQREVTLKRLEVFLGMRRGPSGEETENRKRPFIRNHALRYLYTNLRLQGTAAKTYILNQGKIVRAVFEDIAEDSHTVIPELLEVLKKDVALDSALSYSTKSRVFNDWALDRLATLYRYAEPKGAVEGCPSVQQLAHAFLIFLCTSPGHGVLNHRSAIGPFHKNNSSPDKQLTGRNTKLALFMQGLRPYASVLQSELILAVFQTAPGMVSDYFARKKSFSFDPKATATWIGYSSFLIATVKLPILKAFKSIDVNEWGLHPHNKIIDNFVPEPMTQKTMTRCLNQSTDLVKFLSTKLLIAAFEKLVQVLRKHRSGNDCTTGKRDSSSRDRAASEITTDFCSRIPDIDHVIAQLRACSTRNAVLRESLTRLLALYYVVIPQVALEAKFDVSKALSTVFQGHDPDIESPREDGLRILELDHVLKIARRSPNMQWWHKSERMRLSPFTKLLTLHVDRRQTLSDAGLLRSLLASIVQAYQMLDCGDGMLSLDVLILTLQDSVKWKPSTAVFNFLDICVLRLVRKPVHYYDALCNLVVTVGGAVETIDPHIDLLLIAIIEQWPFLVKAVDDSEVTNVATWLVRYMEMSWLRIRRYDDSTLHRISRNILAQILDQIKDAVIDEKCRSMFNKTLSDPPELGLSIESATVVGINEQKRNGIPIPQDGLHQPQPSMNKEPPGPPEEHEDHPGLNRWTREDTLDAISDGAIEELLLCLCSRYPEIRQQAMRNVCIFMAKLKSPGYSEWQQTYLVAGELIETAKDFNIAETPLPYFAGVLAGRLISIIADPLHSMYEKVNKFLHKGPRWNLAKLPSFWVDKIILNPPTGDEAHYLEAEWLLDALVDGLRTAADFQIYHSCHIFERLLSFSASPSIPKSCLQKVVALLFRCTYVEGSSTLITRCGLISWTTSRLALSESSDAIEHSLRLLACTVYKTSDQERVNEWSHGTLIATIDSLSISQT